MIAGRLSDSSPALVAGVASLHTHNIEGKVGNRELCVSESYPPIGGFQSACRGRCIEKLLRYVPAAGMIDSNEEH